MCLHNQLKELSAQDMPEKVTLFHKKLLFQKQVLLKCSPYDKACFPALISVLNIQCVKVFSCV